MLRLDNSSKRGVDQISMKEREKVRVEEYEINKNNRSNRKKDQREEILIKIAIELMIVRKAD